MEHIQCFHRHRLREYFHLRLHLTYHRRDYCCSPSLGSYIVRNAVDRLDLLKNPEFAPMILSGYFLRVYWHSKNSPYLITIIVQLENREHIENQNTPTPYFLKDFQHFSCYYFHYDNSKNILKNHRFENFFQDFQIQMETRSDHF